MKEISRKSKFIKYSPKGIKIIKAAGKFEIYFKQVSKKDSPYTCYEKNAPRVYDKRLVNSWVIGALLENFKLNLIRLHCTKCT